MIGQHYNKRILMRWKRNKQIPHFIIIEGAKGSGRLTFAKEILKLKDDFIGIIQENKIDAVRDTIENATKMNKDVAFIFRDFNLMSNAGKNALLLLAEEPPENVYIILTINKKELLLNTLVSRADCISMQPYTKDELKQIAGGEMDGLEYINVPGELDIIKDLDKFNKYKSIAADIIMSLESKSGLNLFKCTSKIENDYDVSFIWKLILQKINKSKLSRRLLNIMSHFSFECSIGAINQKNALEIVLLDILLELKGKE